MSDDEEDPQEQGLRSYFDDDSDDEDEEDDFLPSLESTILPRLDFPSPPGVSDKEAASFVSSLLGFADFEQDIERVFFLNAKSMVDVCS
jgi:hypothetical protein